jgi:hypothetical protein
MWPSGRVDNVGQKFVRAKQYWSHFSAIIFAYQLLITASLTHCRSLSRCDAFREQVPQLPVKYEDSVLANQVGMILLIHAEKLSNGDPIDDPHVAHYWQGECV